MPDRLLSELLLFSDLSDKGLQSYKKFKKKKEGEYSKVGSKHFTTLYFSMVSGQSFKK